MFNFWCNRSLVAPDLAAYAMRLSTTTANTVTPERSFSALKLIQTRLRNKLTLERLNQLLFIYFNARPLSQEGTRATAKRKRV